MAIKANPWTQSDLKLFENLVDSDQVMINHAIIPAGDGFTAHHTDSNVYLQVLRGTISLTVESGEIQEFTGGQIVEIPYQTLIKIDNKAAQPLELIVIKAPNPKLFT